jgi:hypothetical protein
MRYSLSGWIARRFSHDRFSFCIGGDSLSLWVISETAATLRYVAVTALGYGQWVKMRPVLPMAGEDPAKRSE